MQATHRSEKVRISPGQEVRVEGQGTATIALVEGVVGVGGIILQSGHEFTVALSAAAARHVLLASPEGGVVNIQMEKPFRVSQPAPSDAPSIARITRKAIANQNRSVTVCVGGPRSGKSYAASIIANTLAKVGSNQSVVVGVDTSCNGNVLYAPGCVSAREIKVSEPLHLGESASYPYALPVSFFFGATELSTTSLPYYLTCVEQLVACGEWIGKESLNALAAAGSATRTHFVVDTSRVPAGSPPDAFYRRLFQILKPTNVVVMNEAVLSTAPSSSSSSLYASLEEDYLRIMPGCKFHHFSGVQSDGSLDSTTNGKPDGAELTAFSSLRLAMEDASRSLLLEEYFCGSVSNPLGCTKVAVPLTALKFVTLNPQTSQVESIVSGGQKLVDRLSEVLRPGLVCAVSHAVLEMEVPLANIAGLVVVHSVDTVSMEVVVYSPGSEESIPRSYFLVPYSVTHLLMGDHNNSTGSSANDMVYRGERLASTSV